MDSAIPSSGEVRQRLAGFRHADLRALSKLSGVPFTTLWKIRSGETQNPGIETVRQFLPFVAAQEPTHAA